MLKKFFTREVKLGLLAVICAFVLFFGLNFLKGINIFNPTNCYFVKYSDLGGLMVSSPVYIKGYKVGQISDINYDFTQENPFVVTLDIDTDIQLPNDVVAQLHDDGLLGGKCISLSFAPSNMVYAKRGDTIQSEIIPNMTEMLTEVVMPRLNGTMNKLDTLLLAMSTIAQSEDLAQSMKSIRGLTSNLEATSGELATVCEKGVPGMIDGVNKATSTLTEVGRKVTALPLENTVDSLNMAVGEFYTVVQKMSSTEGTMGRLINDPALYDNLSQASSNANALVLDIKDHPKRYINVSIFGRKEK